MFQPADVYDLGNIQLEFKTHTATKSSKMQAFPCYSLPQVVIFSILSDPELNEHFPQISPPIALTTAGRERPFHSQPGLCSTFISRPIQLLLPECVEAHIPSEKLVCENTISASQMMQSMFAMFLCTVGLISVKLKSMMAVEPLDSSPSP